MYSHVAAIVNEAKKRQSICTQNPNPVLLWFKKYGPKQIRVRKTLSFHRYNKDYLYCYLTKGFKPAVTSQCHVRGFGICQPTMREL
jgi:hypothetical protein